MTTRQRDYGLPGTPTSGGPTAAKGFALNGNVLPLISAGGNIYYLAKFAGILRLDVVDIGAQQTGTTKDARAA
jgi:hypothetical protein